MTNIFDEEKYQVAADKCVAFEVLFLYTHKEGEL